nr:hypothetical protein [Tanacetum cinerariifolium]
MHKAFPLPVIEFLLAEEVPTASEESSHCQKKRDATAKRIALLVTEFRDSYEVPASAATTNTTRGGNGKKTGRTVTLTAEDMQKRKNDKKSKPNSQNMAFISLVKHSRGNEDVNTASVSTTSTNVPTASTNIGVATISQDTTCAYIASQSRKKISIQGSDVAGFDKSKVKCFNCHKMGHFAREVGWDWSYMANDEEDHALIADEEALTEFSLMANTSPGSKVFDNSLCSKDCNENNDSLNSKKISIHGSDVAGFDKSKVECFNCHKMGHFARECKAPRSQDRGRRDNFRHGSKAEE